MKEFSDTVRLTLLGILFFLVFLTLVRAAYPWMACSMWKRRAFCTTANCSFWCDIPLDNMLFVGHLHPTCPDCGGKFTMTPRMSRWRNGWEFQ